MIQPINLKRLMYIEHRAFALSIHHVGHGVGVSRSGIIAGFAVARGVGLTLTVLRGVGDTRGVALGVALAGAGIGTLTTGDWFAAAFATVAPAMTHPNPPR
jgi:hypothetical protein